MRLFPIRHTLYAVPLFFCLPAFADETINIANPSAGRGWTFDTAVVTISANGNYIVTGSSTTNRIVINKNVTATVTLNNASIHSAVASPFMLSSDTIAGGKGSQITLNLSGSNELVSTERNSAGLTVEDSARITVEGTGSLLAAGGGLNPSGGAGIGGGNVKTAGAIIIKSGTVTATGGFGSAGIGGGVYNNGGNITIAGGSITATGGMTGAAIGGGYSGNGGDITITGGTITATGGLMGAAIGGGYSGNGGDITITGGTVTATGGRESAGIGGGRGGNNGGNITVTGGTITATGGYSGAGIGGGYRGAGGNITVTGGAITATGGYSGAGIGGGLEGSGGNNTIITITGGMITATGGETGAGIGGGGRRDGGIITITGGTVTATGGTEAAGIGSGREGNNGGNITVIGGMVTATSKSSGAGIGGGYWGAGGSITITGGVVVAVTPGSNGDPASIGGGAECDAGTVNITGGTVYASGGTGPGIGGGAHATGGVINITGGTVIADDIGMGNTRTETHISGANTIALSPSINTTTFGGAQVLTGTNIGISCSVSSESMDYKVTLNEDLTIPSGATLVVPAGIVFDVNHKVLTNHGTISNYGSIINAGNLTGNQPNTVMAGWIEDIPAQTYTGNPIEPAVTVTDGSLTLTLNTDYTVEYRDNVDKGTATATVTGKGNYTGSASKNFIIFKPFSAGWIADIPAQTYSGDSIEPAVTVTDGSLTLTLNTDYTVAYTNNVNAGTATATATVTGTGYYVGTIVKSFTIAPKALADGSIQDIPAQPWTGDTIIPAVVVRDGSRILTPDTDYTITYSNIVHAGVSTVRVIGRGNYFGNAYGYFDILPRQIATEWLEDVPQQVWTGEAIEPAVTVRDGDGTLTPGTDYKVTYANNVNVGPEAWVSVTGVGNYTGTKSKMFSIVSPQTDTVPTPPPADTVPKAVTGVSFYNDSYIVEKGQSLQLFALFVPADAGNRNVSWATSNKAVATVSAGGKVTAVSAGEATITVTTEDGGYRDTCLIRVPGIVTTKDTVIYQKIIFYERDTLYRDTTVYRTDTLYNDTTVHRVDTLYRDTTLYLTDTLYRDTTVYRTDTLYNDTIIYVVNIVQVDSIDYNLVPDTVYVVTDITGAEHAVTENARVVRVGTVLRIEGLTPGKTFSIYTIKGEKYYSGTAQSDVFRLNNIPQGVYILYHNGQYSKFSY